MHVWNLFDSLSTEIKIGIGAGAVAISVAILRRLRKRRSGPLKKDWKTDVVYLFQFPPTPKLPSISPFSLKLETWLRLHSIPYENIPIAPSVFSKQGQTPFIEMNGLEYCDSGFIIDHLTKQFHIKDGLSPQQRALGRALEQMVEHVTFWSYSQVRYVEKINEFYSESALGWKLSFFMIPIIRFFLAHAMQAKLHWHGIGRHKRDDVIQIGLDDLKAVSNCLGSKPYLNGDLPSRADAAVFGVLAQILYFPVDTPHAKTIRKNHSNLIQHAERMKQKFWQDWDIIYKNYRWKKQLS